MGALLNSVLSNDVEYIHRIFVELSKPIADGNWQAFLANDSFWELVADIASNSRIKAELRGYIIALLDDDWQTSSFIFDLVSPGMPLSQRRLVVTVLQLPSVAALLRSDVFWRAVLDRRFVAMMIRGLPQASGDLTVLLEILEDQNVQDLLRAVGGSSREVVNSLLSDALALRALLYDARQQRRREEQEWEEFEQQEFVDAAEVERIRHSSLTESIPLQFAVELLCTPSVRELLQDDRIIEVFFQATSPGRLLAKYRRYNARIKEVVQSLGGQVSLRRLSDVLLEISKEPEVRVVFEVAGHFEACLEEISRVVFEHFLTPVMEREETLCDSMPPFLYIASSFTHHWISRRHDTPPAAPPTEPQWTQRASSVGDTSLREDRRSGHSLRDYFLNPDFIQSLLHAVTASSLTQPTTRSSAARLTALGSLVDNDTFWGFVQFLHAHVVSLSTTLLDAIDSTMPLWRKQRSLVVVVIQQFRIVLQRINSGELPLHEVFLTDKAVLSSLLDMLAFFSGFDVHFDITPGERALARWKMRRTCSELVALIETPAVQNLLYRSDALWDLMVDADWWTMVFDAERGGEAATRLFVDTSSPLQLALRDVNRVFDALFQGDTLDSIRALCNLHNPLYDIDPQSGVISLHSSIAQYASSIGAGSTLWQLLHQAQMAPGVLDALLGLLRCATADQARIMLASIVDPAFKPTTVAQKADALKGLYTSGMVSGMFAYSSGAALLSQFLLSSLLWGSRVPREADEEMQQCELVHALVSPQPGSKEKRAVEVLHSFAHHMSRRCKELDLFRGSTVRSTVLRVATAILRDTAASAPRPAPLLRPLMLQPPARPVDPALLPPDAALLVLTTWVFEQPLLRLVLGKSDFWSLVGDGDLLRMVLEPPDAAQVRKITPIFLRSRRMLPATFVRLAQMQLLLGQQRIRGFVAGLRRSDVTALLAQFSSEAISLAGSAPLQTVLDELDAAARRSKCEGAAQRSAELTLKVQHGVQRVAEVASAAREQQLLDLVVQQQFWDALLDETTMSLLANGQLLSLLGNATVRSIFMRSMDRSIRSLGQFLLARRKPGGGDVEEAGKGTLRERFSSALRKLRVRREEHVDPLHVRAASAVASIVNRAAGMVQGRTSHRARL